MNSELLELAIKAAISAGNYIISKRQLNINSENDRDIKLQSDLNSEKLVFETLTASGINILSEEAGVIIVNRDSDLRWIVDPLDGSLNFSRNIPLNCISIALWNKDQPTLGVIYDYNHKELYTGVVGKGAFLNNQPIQVSTVNEKSKSIITTGFPVYTSFEDQALLSFIKMIQDYKKVRLLGSAALSLALLAKGSVEAYAENNIALWDVAAGVALVLAAGGTVDFKFSSNNENLMNVFVTNGKLKK